MSALWQDSRLRPLPGNNPLFRTIEEWYPPDEPTKQKEHHNRFLQCWNFMRPFFASRGFILYEYGPHHMISYPPVQDLTEDRQDNDPYGRRFYETREYGMFCIPSCLRLWAAQDSLGRDVVIKIVPEEELKVMRYLNTVQRRGDPRNHTIPLIDSGTFGGFSFAIMPRWDGAFGFHCKTVAELMQCTKVLLEGLDFMHENRVFHGDILDQNIGMNVVLELPYGGKQPLGLRDPSSTRYAYYDFETSAIYPPEMPLEDILETEYYGFAIRGIPRPDGPFKVFPLDVLCLGLLLQGRTKHIEDIIPELGPFLSGMLNSDEDARFTAREASVEFEKLYARLNSDQLSKRLKSYLWTRKHGILYLSPGDR